VRITRKNNKRTKLAKLGQQYIDWRNSLPLAWRIVFDIVSTILVIGVAVYALMLAVVILVPILILLGLARGSGNSRSSDQQWHDDNDPRGNSPHSMAPGYFD